jgi:hypothetical protein
VEPRDEPGSAFDPPRERFEPRGEIGRGGMGRVDDAFDRALGRPVAIKHMLSPSSVDLARFEREARITARLEHPGIVPIHDAGRGPDGTPYYVMRRVDGKPLDQCVGGTLVERLALIPNVLAACDAVGFAHARGIVHRDIKPTNILVGPFGETLVIDWGLAREIGDRDGDAAVVPASDRELTRAGTVAGTPGFMAPEQARGEAVDARADVFALGATLYYVLAAQPPYGAVSATEMIGLAGAGRAADWSVVPAGVPPELRAIADKAMASDAGERYVDATALAADVRRFITGNLVGAYEYGPLARFTRFVRRHRAAVAVSVVSALVVIVVGAISLRRIVAERDDANAARALAEQRQHETAAMTDRLVIEHALELVKTDPVAGIVALRALTPASAKWHEARVVARAAAVEGIPFGFGSHDVFYLQIQADNRRLMTVNRATGELAVIDLIARTRRVVTATGSEPYGAAWLGASHVAIGYRDHLAIVDIDHGTTRSITIEVRHVVGNRGTTVWIWTQDARLLELADPDGTPRELADHVIDFTPSPDFSEAVVERDAVVEVWTPTAHVPIVTKPRPGAPWVGAAAIDRDRVLVVAEKKLMAWRIANDKVTPVHVPELGFVNTVEIIGGRFVVGTTGGLWGEGARGYTLLANVMGVVFHASGALIGADQGTITIVDPSGAFRIARRATDIVRADMSRDGRFVVVASTSEVLIWERHSQDPVHLPFDDDKIVARVTEHYAWLQSNDGMSRIDLASGEEEPLIAASSIDAIAYVAVDESWSAIAHDGRIDVIDFARKRPLTFAGATIGDLGATPGEPSGFILARADGTLVRWRAGSDAVATIGTLDAHSPTGLATRDGFVIASFDDHLERVELASGAVERAPVRAMHFAMLDRGVTWFSKLDGTVWRWDRGSAPVDQRQPGPADVAVKGNDVLVYTRETLILIRDGKRSITPVPSRALGWDGGDLAAAVDAHRTAIVVDLVSGLRFVLPGTFTNVDVFGGRIVATNDHSAEIWKLDVPAAPDALHGWLETVTNARRLPDSEAYAWP